MEMLEVNGLQMSTEKLPTVLMTQDLNGIRKKGRSKLMFKRTVKG